MARSSGPIRAVNNPNVIGHPDKNSDTTAYNNGLVSQSGTLGSLSSPPTDALILSATANAAAANTMIITNAALGQATTVTIPDPGTAAATVVLNNVAGFAQEAVTNITAGAVQTQAGATAITSSIAVVTTGTAGDGVILPALSAAKIGTRVQLINSSVNAGRIYCPGATSTNTINGTAGATGIVYAASKTLFLVAISATAWVSTLSN